MGHEVTISADGRVTAKSGSVFTLAKGFQSDGIYLTGLVGTDGSDFGAVHIIPAGVNNSNTGVVKTVDYITIGGHISSYDHPYFRK